MKIINRYKNNTSQEYVNDNININKPKLMSVRRMLKKINCNAENPGSVKKTLVFVVGASDLQSNSFPTIMPTMRTAT